MDSQGGISRSTDFRTNFVHLGSYAVLDEKSASRGLHDVYTEKASAEHYRKTGKFLDGATLVKEIRKLETSAMTTGNPVVWGSDAAVWFVMVKDSTGRYPDNPLWGDGWGWAWFDADSPAATTTTNYQEDCLGCHTPVEASDWLHVFAYPVLER